jgi:hypothetical protein
VTIAALRLVIPDYCCFRSNSRTIFKTVAFQDIVRPADTSGRNVPRRHLQSRAGHLLAPQTWDGLHTSYRRRIPFAGKRIRLRGVEAHGQIK